LVSFSRFTNPGKLVVAFESGQANDPGYPQVFSGGCRRKLTFGNQVLYFAAFFEGLIRYLLEIFQV